MTRTPPSLCMAIARKLGITAPFRSLQPTKRFRSSSDGGLELWSPGRVRVHSVGGFCWSG